VLYHRVHRSRDRHRHPAAAEPARCVGIVSSVVVVVVIASPPSDDDYGVDRRERDGGGGALASSGTTNRVGSQLIIIDARGSRVDDDASDRIPRTDLTSREEGARDDGSADDAGRRFRSTTVPRDDVGGGVEDGGGGGGGGGGGLAAGIEASTARAAQRRRGCQSSKSASGFQIAVPRRRRWANGQGDAATNYGGC